MNLHNAQCNDKDIKICQVSVQGNYKWLVRKW